MTYKTEELLEHIWIDGGLFHISVGSIDKAGWLDAKPLFNTPAPKDKDVYYGPAMRATQGHERKDVLGTRVLWVDVDDANPNEWPLTTLAPSAVVWSGHGYHLYWFLSTPMFDIAQIETFNKVLEIDCPAADRGCWNANRLLRLPNTWNVGKGDETPTYAEIRELRAIVYDVDDIIVISDLDDATRHRIRTTKPGLQHVANETSP
jgi:hypothetical protein